jgi:hypothetical protein
MRLKNVETAHRWPRKLMLGAIRILLRERAPDILRTVWYRPEFFGRNYGAYIQEVMRGPSEWSVGERELIAAFVSQKNSCSF